MIKSIKHKGLKKFWTKDDRSGLNQNWVGRISIFMDALDVATEPKHLDFPGSGFHSLTGDRSGFYSLSVSGNWRLTFAFEGEDVIIVNLEDYH